MLLNSQIILGQYSSRDIVILSKTGVNHYFVPKWDLLRFTVEIVAVTIWMHESPGIAWRHFFTSESCWLKFLPLLPAFFKMYYPRLQNIVSITAHKWGVPLHMYYYQSGTNITNSVYANPFMWMGHGRVVRVLDTAVGNGVAWDSGVCLWSRHPARAAIWASLIFILFPLHGDLLSCLLHIVITSLRQCYVSPVQWRTVLIWHMK